MKNLLTAFFLGVLLFACSDNVEEEIMDDMNDDPTEDITLELPKTYLIVAPDTFYLANKSVLADPNVYRIQLNFATKDDLSKTTNDGVIPTTFILGISTLEKLTVSGNRPFTDQRFGTELETKINFYGGFAANSGWERAGENYLSPASGTFTYEISNDQLVADLPAVVVTNEVDALESFEIKGHFEINY